MRYDIIIAGGGTAGCACAYIAGKLGLSVLLVEKNSFLGGTMTSSQVCPAMKTSDNNINTEFFSYLMKSLHEIGGQITYQDGNIGWFNPELMKIVLDKLLEEVNVTVLFDSEISDIKIDNKHIKSVMLKNNTDCIDTKYTHNINKQDQILSEYIETKHLIDATGDAKIFQKINCDFLENKNNFQPNNLRFMMSGIDLKEFSEWIMDIDSDRNVTTSCVIDNNIHLSTAYTWDKDKNWALRPIFEAGIKNGDITLEDSNYFQVFSVPGMPTTLAFNCPRIVLANDIAPNNKIALSLALKQGRASILRLSNFLKKYFKGFENAYISSIANSLGVRVSNRIKGKYIYTIEDLKSGKNFDNPCLISNYPVDIHSKQQDNSVLEQQMQEYMLPIESLISADYDNLYAIGRCIAADF
ncbi:MAG: FAD-dependent oxidoreductase, partial [Candidatus Gastranaerophilales bacterium]|nr:FAD-dependent oxidoreductase [Candidatus Gastranaerophilales bacterium]